MKWTPGGVSQNVEDRRGEGGGGGFRGFGGGGMRLGSPVPARLYERPAG